MSRAARWAASASNSPRRLTTSLGGIKLIRALLAVAVVVASAHLFGASVDRDAWVLASSWMAILAQALFGPLNEIFRAQFVHQRESKGEPEALKSVASLVSLVSLISIGIGILLSVAPGPWIRLLAPSFPLEGHEELAHLLRWVAPTLLLAELALLWTGVLNSYRSFFLPEFFGLLTSLLHLAGLYWLAPRFGIDSLAFTTLTSCLILALVLAIKLLPIFHAKLFAMPDFSKIRLFLITAAPFWMPYALGQLVMLTERAFCTELGVGAVSNLDYARKFSDFPLGVIYAVVGAALTPLLATHHARGEVDHFRKETLATLRWILLGISPLVALLFANGPDVIRFLLLAGKFKASDAEITGQILSLLGIGLVGVVSYTVLGQALVAAGRGGTFSRAAVAVQGGTLLLNLFLYRRWGVITFAMSWSLLHLIFGIRMASKLFSFRELVAGHFYRCLAAVFTAMALLRASTIPVRSWISTLSIAPRWESGWILVIQALIALAFLPAGVWIFGLKEEFALLQKRLRA